MSQTGSRKTVSRKPCDYAALAWEEWRDPEGSLLHVSPACERLSGYPPESFLRDPDFFLSLVHPGDRDRVARSMQGTPRPDSPAITFRLIRADGAEQRLSRQRLPLGPAGQLPAGERVLIGLSHAALEPASRCLAEMGPFVLIIRFADLERAPLYISAKMRRHFGYSAGELLDGRVRLADCIHPRDLEDVRRASLKALAGRPGSCHEVEYRLRNTAGDYRWIREFMVPAEGGGRDGWLNTYLMDCTSRKIADEVIESSLKRLDLVVRSAGLGTWDWERAEGGEATLINGVAGSREPRFFGATWRERVHPDDLEMVERLFAEHLEGRSEQFTAEHRLRTSEGGWTWVLTSGQVVRRDEQGRAARAIGIHLDINARKKAEEESRRLERRLMLAGKFESLHVMAASIAHNFNNMLMAVMGNIEIAKMTISHGGQAREYLDLGMKAARQAVDMSHRMLTYVGRTPLELERCDLAEVLPDMMPLLRAGVPDKVELRFDSEVPALPARVDRTMLQQLLMNLVSNAVEAIDSDYGLVCVGLSVCRRERGDFHPPFDQEDRPPGDYACIMVQDDGRGMSKEIREKIFDPFFTTNFTGRGLGMAAVLGIVRGHQGVVEVESEPGRGTTVRILLPIHEEPSASAARGEDAMRTDSNSTLAGRTILLVDDEDMVRDIGTAMLEQFGCQVLAAEDGSAGVRLFMEHRAAIDCVILDIDMPDKTGIEVCHEIRAVEPEARIVIATGYSSEAVLGDAAQALRLKVLEKPFRMRDLENILIETINAPAAVGGELAAS